MPTPKRGVATSFRVKDEFALLHFVCFTPLNLKSTVPTTFYHDARRVVSITTRAHVSAQRTYPHHSDTRTHCHGVSTLTLNDHSNISNSSFPCFLTVRFRLPM